MHAHMMYVTLIVINVDYKNGPLNNIASDSLAYRFSLSDAIHAKLVCYY